MADQSLDAASMARDQRRMVASAAIGLNALKPVLQFQVSLLRLWADNIEALAQNYEENYQKELDTVSSVAEHRRQQQRAA
jgi:proline dehydrogenase